MVPTWIWSDGRDPMTFDTFPKVEVVRELMFMLSICSVDFNGMNVFFWENTTGYLKNH